MSFACVLPNLMSIMLRRGQFRILTTRRQITAPVVCVPADDSFRTARALYLPKRRIILFYQNDQLLLCARRSSADGCICELSQSVV